MRECVCVVRLLLTLHWCTNMACPVTLHLPLPSPPHLSPFHRAKPLIPRWITSYLIVITFIWQVGNFSCASWNLLSTTTNVLLGFLLPSLSPSLIPSLPPSLPPFFPPSLPYSLPPSLTPSRPSMLVSWRSYI